MYIIYVNHDSVIKKICQLRDKAFLINETTAFAILGRTNNKFYITQNIIVEQKFASLLESLWELVFLRIHIHPWVIVIEIQLQYCAEHDVCSNVNPRFKLKGAIKR